MQAILLLGNRAIFKLENTDIQVIFQLKITQMHAKISFVTYRETIH